MKRPLLKQTCLSSFTCSIICNDKFTKCPVFVTMCDRMGDTKVMFKCATAVTLCVLHPGSPFLAFPSQCLCVADRENLRHLASAILTCIADEPPTVGGTKFQAYEYRTCSYSGVCRRRFDALEYAASRRQYSPSSI